MKHIETHKAGSNGYNAAHRRGTVDLWCDQTRYIYKTETPRTVRAFIAHAWQQENVAVTGRYPSYIIESKP
jgi:hypothetical protein